MKNIFSLSLLTVFFCQTLYAGQSECLPIVRRDILNSISKHSTLELLDVYELSPKLALQRIDSINTKMLGSYDYLPSLTYNLSRPYTTSIAVFEASLNSANIGNYNQIRVVSSFDCTVLNNYIVNFKIR